MAVKLRAEGKDAEADEVEKLAQLLDVAVESKLEVEAGQKEKESKEGMKEAAAEGHAVADQLREEGNGELADMVDNVVEEVEHIMVLVQVLHILLLHSLHHLVEVVDLVSNLLLLDVSLS